MVPRDHLRAGSRLNRLPGFESESATPVHAPSWLVERMYLQIREWRSQGLIDGDDMRALDEETRRFLDICGGANAFAIRGLLVRIESLQGSVFFCTS